MEQTFEGLPEGDKSELLRYLLKNHLAELKAWLSGDTEIQVVQYGNGILIAPVHQPESDSNADADSNSGSSQNSHEFGKAFAEERMKRLKEIWGDYVFTESEAAIRESRGDH